MPKGMTQKTGNAPFKRTGHTASNNYGSNDMAKRKGSDTARDLKAK